MNTNAEAKIKMLKGSLRCFAYGLLSFIPLFGFPFAFRALWISGRVRSQEKLFWNAARPYRIWGVACAAAGTVLWCFALMLIIYNIINKGCSEGDSYMSGD
jgi:hypothetical protein